VKHTVHKRDAGLRFANKENLPAYTLDISYNTAILDFKSSGLYIQSERRGETISSTFWRSKSNARSWHHYEPANLLMPSSICSRIPNLIFWIYTVLLREAGVTSNATTPPSEGALITDLKPGACNFSSI
jgi:hypothetical protein